MDVLKLRYMKRIRFILRSIGAWPSFVFENNPTTKWSFLMRYGYTLLLCVMCSLCMVGQVAYLVKKMGILKFIDLGQTCLTFLLCCVFVQRTLLPLQGSYTELIEEFVSKFHLYHHRHNSDYSAEMYNRVNKYCEIATIFQFVQVYATGIMFNFQPLYANFRDGMLSSNRPVNGTFDFAVKYELPVDQSKFGWFTLVSLYNCYATYNLSCMICCHDLLITVFVFHIWGHLHIFEHNLISFQQPNTANTRTVPLRYTKEEMKEVSAKLRDIIKYYLMIKQFVGKTSETYHITLFVYYSFHLVGDCVLLLECSTLEMAAITKYGLLTILMYEQLIQVSVAFELINFKGNAIIDAAYGLPWECMDTGNRRTVVILLQMVQQSLSLKACNVVPVGMRTMLAVIKASYSYFMMLRTFSK